MVDDDDLTPADAAGHELAIVSTTVDPTVVGAAFTAVAVPVITWERRLYDDLGLVASEGDAGERTGTKTLTITDPSHPIASGRSGEVTVTTKNHPLSHGSAGAAADVIATDSTGTRSVIFTYDADALLANGLTAPDKRAALFFT